MILPKSEDVGRRVIYTDGVGKQFHGEITSLNDRFVFVRYDDQAPESNGQATERIDLVYESCSGMTLGEIIDLVRSGEKPNYDDLRYAVCALEALRTFDSMALMRLAGVEGKEKKTISPSSAVFQYEESFNRTKRSLAKPPKEWIGWENDPDNPEFLKRRMSSLKIFEKACNETKKEPKP